MVEELLKILGGTAALIAVLAWLTRTLVIHWLSKDIENHKVRLKDAADRELERTRMDLKRAAFEYETRFSRLHEEIVKAILELYPSIQELYQAVLSYLSVIEWEGEPSKEEKLKRVAEKSKAFRHIYTRTRILFPKQLYKQLDDLSLVLNHATNEFTFGLQREKQGVRLPESHDPWGEAMAAVEDKIKPLFNSMHDALQTILGFPSYTKPEGQEPPPMQRPEPSTDNPIAPPD